MGKDDKGSVFSPRSKQRKTPKGWTKEEMEEAEAMPLPTVPADDADKPEPEKPTD